MNKNKQPSTAMIAGDTFPTGEILRDELKSRNITAKVFAKTLDITLLEMNAILKGKTPVDSALALQLESALGIYASFWLKYQINYETTLIKQAHNKDLEQTLATQKVTAKQKKALQKAIA